MDNSIILILSGFLLGIGVYLKAQERKLKSLKKEDEKLKLEEQRLREKIEEIKKQPDLTPEEIEEFWKNR